MRVRVLKAKKDHGKCDQCPKSIEPGQQYTRVLRLATEEERNDEKIKLVSFYRGGPQRPVKMHIECWATWRSNQIYRG